MSIPLCCDRPAWSLIYPQCVLTTCYVSTFILYACAMPHQQILETTCCLNPTVLSVQNKNVLQWRCTVQEGCPGFQEGLYLTITIVVLWRDSITAARRLHRSWAWLTWTLGGSLSTTVSVDPSRTLGSSSPSFTCNESEHRGRIVERGDLVHLKMIFFQIIPPNEIKVTEMVNF